MRNRKRQNARKIWFRPTLKAHFHTLEEALAAYPQTDASMWLKADSETEFRRFQWLLEQVIAGEITRLKHHPSFVLQDQVKLPKGLLRKRKKSQAAISYEADASYYYKGHLIIEDSKALNKKTGKPIIEAAARLRHKLLICQLINQYGSGAFFKIVTRHDAPLDEE